MWGIELRRLFEVDDPALQHVTESYISNESMAATTGGAVSNLQIVARKLGYHSTAHTCADASWGCEVFFHHEWNPFIFLPHLTLTPPPPPPPPPPRNPCCHVRICGCSFTSHDRFCFPAYYMYFLLPCRRATSPMCRTLHRSKTLTTTDGWRFRSCCPLNFALSPFHCYCQRPPYQPLSNSQSGVARQVTTVLSRTSNVFASSSKITVNALSRAHCTLRNSRLRT